MRGVRGGGGGVWARGGMEGVSVTDIQGCESMLGGDKALERVSGAIGGEKEMRERERLQSLRYDSVPLVSTPQSKCSQGEN